MLQAISNPQKLPRLQEGFNRLRKLVITRLQDHFVDNADVKASIAEQIDSFEGFSFFQEENQTFSSWETIVCLMAVVPHVTSNFFDSCIRELFPQGGDFPEFGGVRGAQHRGMLPTGETVQFIIAGNNIAARLEVQKLFFEESTIISQGIIALESLREGEPVMSGRIIISQDWLGRWLFQKISSPNFSPDFPAKKIFTKMEWDDLILYPQTRQQVSDIIMWVKHHKRLYEDSVISKKVKPGYRVLFYGPPGTGKTLTASLLGKEVGKEIYRIDLSLVVSKYIGETEKNLEKVFERAQDKDWILFFDEADALFGKRTSVQSSHDRYANQEIAYLLQRVEDFPSLIILASNFKSNLDAAFLRRFHALIHFPMPNSNERLQLWKKSLPHKIKAEDSIDWRELASKYELSGASIMNVIQYCALKAIDRSDFVILSADLLEGIRREFRKEEKSTM